MKTIKNYALIVLFGISAIMLSACTAEVGSEQWCADLKEKSKADWTANEAADFTKHCILK